MRCEHCGFLQKLSRGKLSTSWRRRWFELKDDSTLLAFNGTTCVLSLPLANACVRERASTSTSTLSSGGGGGGDDAFEFEVRTATRLYVLRADSEREMHRWLAAIASRTDAFHENASIDYFQILIDDATFARNDRADLHVAATFDAKQPHL